MDGDCYCKIDNKKIYQNMAKPLGEKIVMMTVVVVVREVEYWEQMKEYQVSESISFKECVGSGEMVKRIVWEKGWQRRFKDVIDARKWTLKPLDGGRKKGKKRKK